VEIDLLHFGVGTHHDGTPRENREPSIRDTERSVEDGVYGAHTLQQGVNVTARGAYTQAKHQTIGGQYGYQLEDGKLLKDYNIEQQGEIVRQYFFAIEGKNVERADKIKAVLGNFPDRY
ncbi:hypothetical protein I5H11_01480, partial [Pseudomonas aeruginosa]|nr:hypothetical protein [Pseudomonas aeruginosa]